MIEAIFVSKKVRMTSMRKLIYEVLVKENRALSLAEIEATFDKVDKTTIFRTLKTFQKHCLVHRIDDGTGVLKYALCPEHCTCTKTDLHLHFSCSQCENTYCLNDSPIPEVKISKGFRIDHSSFILKGICQKCNQ